METKVAVNSCPRLFFFKFRVGQTALYRAHRDNSFFFLLFKTKRGCYALMVFNGLALAKFSHSLDSVS